MLFARLFTHRHTAGLPAYNALQVRLLRRFLARGGELEDWTRRLAPAFRTRYGWMLGDRS